MPPPQAISTAIPPTAVHLDAAALRCVLPLSALVPHFAASLPSLSSTVVAPARHSYPLPSPSSPSSALLLMPSWSSDAESLPYLGVKIVTSFPRNSSGGLPGIHASYSLFSATTGAPLASFDGSFLTVLRTAAVSALASSLLSRSDSRVLVIAGAGSLAPFLVAAHRVVRPSIERVIIWNRTPQKARALAEQLQGEEGAVEKKATFEHAERLDDVVPLGDVVSCATRSETPIVRGTLLKPGAHLDLVGSFSPSMRECDDEALARGRVFVDFEVALEEAGELVGAFERGFMTREDVAGTLAELAGGRKAGRSGDDEVTVFKSVGSAVVDLLAAQLAYETFLRGDFELPSTGEFLLSMRCAE